MTEWNTKARTAGSRMTLGGRNQKPGSQDDHLGSWIGENQGMEGEGQIREAQFYC